GAGLAVAALADTRRRAIGVSAIVCAMAFIDGWTIPMPLGAPPRPFGVPAIAGARVLELPLHDDNINVGAMYRGMLHGLPVVNGYAGYVPPHAVVLEWALTRQDPSALTELRRGHPLYVSVAYEPNAQPSTAFLDAQHHARLIGVTGAGRLYLMPPAPFPRQVALGPALPDVRGTVTGEWLTLDLGGLRTVRALDVHTRGHFVLLPAVVRVETTLDGLAWTPAAEEPAGRPGAAG